MLPVSLETPTHLFVYVTTRTAEEAHEIARAAVEGRLAASAQVSPIETHYRWKGPVVTHSEHLITLLTTARCWDALCALVRERHSYELPQIVGAPISHGLAPFLDWIDESTRAEPQGTP